MDILNDELLYTENLSKNFQGITAVDKVNFKINKNEIRALIGPNGAGKTTFVSLLCGRIRASKGKVFLMDQIFQIFLFIKGFLVV